MDLKGVQSGERTEVMKYEELSRAKVIDDGTNWMEGFIGKYEDESRDIKKEGSYVGISVSQNDV